MSYFIGNFLKIFFICVILLLSSIGGAFSADLPSIQFEYKDDTSVDLSVLAESSGAGRHYLPLDQERYTALGRGFLIQDASVPLKAGDRYRLMLICGEIFPSGRLQGIQLVVFDERKTPASVIQRIRLGAGEIPEIIVVPDDTDPAVLMFRVIRAGNDTEARVYSVNRVTGRLDEILLIDRLFPDRASLDVTGAMEADGVVKIVSLNPKRDESVDLSEAMDALIDDGIYQPGGYPIDALRNLKLARNGWEDERIYLDGDKIRVDVGLSLVTLSRKQVVDVTAIYEIDDGMNSCKLIDLFFEPFLLYRSN
ncbi:MAG: hypothetical protein LBQ58_10230 [Synergistaceae bacterium]|nr:hypothetical protein [Synergistaceae bacterium]